MHHHRVGAGGQSVQVFVILAVAPGIVIVASTAAHCNVDTAGGFTEAIDIGRRARDDKVVDVVVPLQCQVKDSKLILQNTSKSSLPGFYDPCVGEEKSLRIVYDFLD